MSQTLLQLYQEIYGPTDAPGKMNNLAELGQTLARLINRPTPFGARQLNGAMCGHKGMAVTVELTTALNILAGKLDGQNPLQANAKPIQLLALNGSVLPGSVVLGKTVRCHGCQTPIIPRVPWQKYCTRECRATTTKKQAVCTPSALAIAK